MLSRLLGAGLLGSSSQTAAAAVVATAWQQQHWVRASSTNSSSSATSTSSSKDSEVNDLTPEQQQHLDTLRYLISRPLEAAQNAALLTALTASYRDLYVVMDQFHKRDILGVPRPLLDDPPAASSSSSKEQQQQQPDQQQQQQQQQQQLRPPQQINHTQMFYPQRDLTKLPDEMPPPDGFYRYHLQEQYMQNHRTAYAQMLPNHLEVSYHVNAFIYLWSPEESFFPALFEPEYVLRHLAPHFKKSRRNRSQKQRKVRCSLGWRKNKPYHKQRVFGTPTVPAALRFG